MNPVTRTDLQKLYVPHVGSHKGQNGRLLIIGGSHLFHAASLWALTVASRIVDLVHYASVPENNQIVQKAKEEFRSGIVIHRDQVEEYIEEDDCILIGPGMTRDIETKELTDRLLKKYPQKQWVIDAGALQMMDVSLIPKNAILTPHHGEFFYVFGKELSESGLAATRVVNENLDPSIVVIRGDKNFLDPLLTSPPLASGSTPQSHLSAASVSEFGKRSAKILSPLIDEPESGRNFIHSPRPAWSLEESGEMVKYVVKKHNCIVFLKGEIDIACSPTEMRVISGGNVGMTKGGTGDVLAGLIAALACKSDPFLATIAGSFINKAAGNELYKTVGPYFNATDLAHEIPRTMKRVIRS